MNKKSSIIIVFLFFTYSLSDILADPGVTETSQFRRRNYYLDVYGGTWRANLAVGGGLYVGEEDLLYMKAKRIAPGMVFSLQRDISETVGFRVKYNASAHKNFYWPKDIIPFYSMGISADILANATKIIAPYAEPTTPKIWLYVGAGGEYSFEQALHKKYDVSSRITPTYNMGSLVEIPVKDNLDITVELRGTIVSEAFDGQIRGIALEGYATFLVGVSYHLN